jgi:hypothetical protein
MDSTPDERPSSARDGQARYARRGAMLALERLAAVAKHMARLAMLRGDWEGAADFEQQAIMAEHRAGLLRAADPGDWPAP